MNAQSEIENMSEKALSARETGRLIEAMVSVFRYSDLQSEAAADALQHVAKMLMKFGDHPITSFKAIPNYTQKPPQLSRLRKSYKDLDLNDAEKVLADQTSTKSLIADLAHDRFGIPRSRLSRSRLEEAIEIVRAAINHERSLDAISVSAEKAGSNRQS